MASTLQRTPPPKAAPGRDTSRTPMHHMTVTASTDPLGLLKALEQDVVCQVEAAKTRNGIVEDGPASPELLLNHATVSFDDAQCDDGMCADEEEAMEDDVPAAIAALRAANAAVLND